ncbi:hypothetical protein J2X46_003902 [Nocardioides sp. BE266]|uniref:hypothetical protein n=1 Tax=Nocardioides sp. BE266 TaxID=2817725 RepID=UPI0028578534|nr:hypothetical protein [Nocardioides sp. BE266]MDR7254904.1 hypothetical protein [Nocardioides sp. BE266]
MTERHEVVQRVLWVPMGGLLGAFSGAIAGSVLLLGTVVIDTGFVDGGPAAQLVGSAVMGAVYGGIAGFVVGLFVGAEMMFAIGPQLPRDVARRRAYALGFVLPPATMVALVQLMALMDDGTWVGFGGVDLGTLVLLVGASLMGGPLARWLAGWQRPERPVS